MKTLLLIDANALIHRTFHALPPLTSPDNKPTGALYGIASILIKRFREQPPDYIAAAFDRPEPTFRKEMFADYKAHRPPAAQELVAQIIEAHTLFQKFGIMCFEKPGFEADDIIGTIVNKLKIEKELRIIILTGDRDALQLVHGNRVVVEVPKKGISETQIFDEKTVEATYGIAPNQIPDYKGLVGDASDNIPGVKGIGPKTAVKLLAEFGTLERMGEKILKDKMAALFSKKLATLNNDVDIEISLGALAFHGLGEKQLEEYFAALGFKTLLKRISAQQQLI